MPTGVMKFFLPRHRYGFIAGTGGNPDLFVPASGLADPDAAPPTGGDIVSYTLARDYQKRPKAIRVRVIQRATASATREDQPGARSSAPVDPHPGAYRAPTPGDLARRWLP
ncbi:cold shock domain-containing protein [Nocardia terpenica]|nr:cold shock domain-containing protein [Nocardia terpenica]